MSSSDTIHKAFTAINNWTLSHVSFTTLPAYLLWQNCFPLKVSILRSLTSSILAYSSSTDTKLPSDPSSIALELALAPSDSDWIASGSITDILHAGRNRVSIGLRWVWIGGCTRQTYISVSLTWWVVSVSE